MPKMVRCFKDGVEKFQDKNNIPPGWVIDRLMPKPDLPPMLDIKPEPVLSSGLDITGQPDAFKEGDVIGEQKAPKGMGEAKIKSQVATKKSKSKEQPCPPELK